MKICFLTGNLFTLGGVQRVTTVIASKLSEYHDVTVLCVDNNTIVNRKIYELDERVKIDIKYNLFKKNIVKKIHDKILKGMNQRLGCFNNKSNLRLLTNIYYPAKMQEQLINYFNLKNYDVVIGVGGLYSIMVGVIADRISSKTVGWQHNSYDAYFRNKGRYYWNQDELFNTYIRKLDKYIVLTNYDKEMLFKEKGISCDVIYNPRSFVSDEKSTVKKKQFLAAGRFTHQKGFDLLVESFNEFVKVNNDWSLVIVGEGEEKNEIIGLIDSYKLADRIKIEDFTDNIKQFFLDSSVLLLSSRWEGMPMIVLESFEMGVPVISYDITASQQLIANEEDGILVKRYDIRAFANAMFELSKSYTRRAEMSDKSILKSKKFDVDNIINHWISMLNYILDK